MKTASPPSGVSEWRLVKQPGGCGWADREKAAGGSRKKRLVPAEVLMREESAILYHAMRHDTRLA